DWKESLKMKNEKGSMLAKAAVFSFFLLPFSLAAGDWPQWGNTPDRNMISDAKDLPVEWSPGKKKEGTEDFDLATSKNVKWIAKIGSQCYGNPTVSNGKVFVGTNNT